MHPPSTSCTSRPIFFREPDSGIFIAIIWMHEELREGRMEHNSVTQTRHGGESIAYIEVIRNDKKGVAVGCVQVRASMDVRIGRQGA